MDGLVNSMHTLTTADVKSSLTNGLAKLIIMDIPCTGIMSAPTTPTNQPTNKIQPGAPKKKRYGRRAVFSPY